VIVIHNDARSTKYQNSYSYWVVTDVFPRNWEFGSALSKLRNLGGGGIEHPQPPRYATGRGPFQTRLLINFVIFTASVRNIVENNLVNRDPSHSQTTGSSGSPKRRFVSPIANRAFPPATRLLREKASPVTPCFMSPDGWNSILEY
jgi:hypothetical protein